MRATITEEQSRLVRIKSPCRAHLLLSGTNNLSSYSHKTHLQVSGICCDTANLVYCHLNKASAAKRESCHYRHKPALGCVEFKWAFLIQVKPQSQKEKSVRHRFCLPCSYCTQPTLTSSCWHSTHGIFWDNMHRVVFSGCSGGHICRCVCVVLWRVSRYPEMGKSVSVFQERCVWIIEKPSRFWLHDRFLMLYSCRSGLL